MSEAQQSGRCPPAGLLRRVGAMVSDCLVVLGLLLLTTLLFVPLLSHLNAKALVPSEVGWFWVSIYWASLLLVWVGFFVFFWVRRGQTVGMQAWHLRVENERGMLLTWSGALTRIGYAAVPWLPCLVVLQLAERYQSLSIKYIGITSSLIGIAGLLLMYADPQKRTWHDRQSKSRVIQLTKLGI